VTDAIDIPEDAALRVGGQTMTLREEADTVPS
jgi:hypothetical protein